MGDKTDNSIDSMKHAPDLARNIVNNFDYDDNGKISEKELFFDVTIEDLSRLDLGSFRLIKILKFLQKEHVYRLKK